MRGTGKEAILDAARQEFGERGYAAVSIRDIARRAGVSLSAMYHYYPGKQDLLHALVNGSGQAYFDACREELASAGDDPGEQLAAVVRATVRYRAEYRLESSLTLTEWRSMSEEGLAEFRRRRLDGTRMFEQIIEDGVAQGVFRTPHPKDARRGVIAMCNAVAQWYRESGEESVPDLAERYVELALVLVEYRPAARRSRIPRISTPAPAPTRMSPDNP
ncbi:TetR/AcrR family transcriptional regulator [Streptomyces sp. B-S-A8]|uniref:TetR/AcrR family transcriptional regulator n=1 Tax=Streptomyces solicavernae TaxID=3043614 RepID=A0ABT6RVF5_9ACTN|nr:TetR/AcrR family transcriptional regulator [Streptomyces sp. B-S-A8]MDI3388428.1 TetR/AcrR family transcriptional regulator [Streptomyces sp. B-S-A8]